MVFDFIQNFAVAIRAGFLALIELLLRFRKRLS